MLFCALLCQKDVKNISVLHFFAPKCTVCLQNVCKRPGCRNMQKEFVMTTIKLCLARLQCKRRICTFSTLDIRFLQTESPH